MYRDITMAIDFPRRRIHCRGDAREIYSWLCEFFDQFTYLTYEQPLLINGELQSDYWEIDHWT